MNYSGAIPITKKIVSEEEMIEYLMGEVGSETSIFRVYRYFTTRVNNETGTYKFSLSKNTITYLKKSNIVSDVVVGGVEISLKDVAGNVRYYLIEEL